MPKRKKTAAGADGDSASPAKKDKTDSDASVGTDGERWRGTKDEDAKTKDGRKWTLKMSSWNVNGLRSWAKNDGMKFLRDFKPDILTIQETKCPDDKLPKEVKIEGYQNYWVSGDKDGYSGVGLYTKTKPINVTYGIGEAKHDKEGRVITAEYEKFYFVGTYIPNAGRGLVRLKYRHQEWDPAFRKYLEKLDKKKPVIMTGDLNVAHQEIDLKNPKTNKNKSSGFTDQEREGFTELLDAGFLDSFRELYPDSTGTYSFWSYMGNARGKNVGWRLDYFVISKRLLPDLCDSIIQQEVMGSDHCPISLYMAL